MPVFQRACFVIPDKANALLFRVTRRLRGVHAVPSGAFCDGYVPAGRDVNPVPAFWRCYCGLLIQAVADSLKGFIHAGESLSIAFTPRHILEYMRPVAFEDGRRGFGSGRCSACGVP